MKHTKNFETFVSESSNKEVNEAAKWISKNITMEFYNLWASLDVAASNMSHFMDDMQKGKIEDAYYSLKITFDELTGLLKKKEIEKELKNIEAELRDNNKLK